MKLFGVKVGKHKVHNHFPNILWKYGLPKQLNVITRRSAEPRLYKWLCWYISVPPSAKDIEIETDRERNEFDKEYRSYMGPPDSDQLHHEDISYKP